jgi:hypothetical protein
LERPRGPSGPAWRSPWLRIALTVGGAIAALVLITWFVRKPETASSPPNRRIAGASIDLGAGTTRGGSPIPYLILAADVEQVDILFVPPVNAEAIYEIEIQDPQQRITAGAPRGPLAIAPDGVSRYRAERRVFAIGGDYVLRLREFTAEGDVHEYSYPFRVSVAARP